MVDCEKHCLRIGRQQRREVAVERHEESFRERTHALQEYCISPSICFHSSEVQLSRLGENGTRSAHNHVLLFFLQLLSEQHCPSLHVFSSRRKYHELSLVLL